MLTPQYQVLVQKLSPIYSVSLNMVFSIPQNQCYPGTSCSTVFSIVQFPGGAKTALSGDPLDIYNFGVRLKLESGTLII